MATMNVVVLESVVTDFVRSLGYEPKDVCEVNLTPFEVTVSGYRTVEGRVLSKDGRPVKWTKTVPIMRGTK